MKLCKLCNIQKNLIEFPIGRAQCKNCRKIKMQQWIEKNKNKIHEKNKIKWQKLKNNPDQILKRKKWYEKNKNRLLSQKKEYYELNKQKILMRHKLYERMKLKTDPIFRLRKNLRRRLNLCLKNIYKKETTLKLIGCTLEELKIYLENRFKKGMSWQNYGEWHIDHIKPISSFDLNIIENQKKAMHYTNLQPLWAKENISKGNKF